MNEMQVAERKVLRGDVIEKLYQNYGTDIRIAILKNYLRIRGFVTEEELRKAIYYLGGEGKRYIHVEVNKDNWLDGTIWLTPAGVNLAEGDIEDMGVIIDFKRGREGNWAQGDHGAVQGGGALRRRYSGIKGGA